MKLRQLKDKNLIKVITGMRRAGKSTLLAMFRQELVETGVAKEATHYFNFDDPAYNRPDDWQGIYQEVKNTLLVGQKNYVFLDEIQNIKEFEKLADGLFLLKEVDLYVTGSNAFFLSSELATLLTGRYLEIKVFPLSFSEYHDFFSFERELSRGEKFERYRKFGGLPEVANFIAGGIDEQVGDYLLTVYNSIVQKDIIPRYNFGPNVIFDNVLRFALDSVGSIVSPNNIKNSINAWRQGEKQVSVERVDNYLQALTSSFILYKAERYDVKGKALLRTLNKYYVVDSGIRNAILGKDDTDVGHILENIVYLELLRRGNQVWIGKVDDKEVDFVVRDSEGGTEYYQVVESMIGEEVRRRELTVFNKIADHNPKYILTLVGGGESYNGVRVVNVIDWLLA